MATITDIRDVRERELTWPESRPRTSSRRNSSFYNTEVDKCERQVIAEIERLRPLDFVISRNRQRHLAGDPGVAVWWVDRKSKELRVLASDRYHTMAENLRALALTLEAMRALDRCGHSERVDSGAALRHGWPKHCGYTMTIDSPEERAAPRAGGLSR